MAMNTNISTQMKGFMKETPLRRRFIGDRKMSKRFSYMKLVSPVIGLLVGLSPSTLSASLETNPLPEGSQIQDVRDLKELDTPLVPLSQATPVYPPELRNRGITGEALVGFIVTPEGKVVEAYAIRAEHPEFGSAAVEAVSKWEFEPPLSNGRPVHVRTQVPALFSINGGESNEVAEVVNPTPIHQPKPEYPFWMRRAAVSGRVLVSFLVDVKGRVRDPFVAESSHPGFRGAAIETIKKWKFRPATRDGIPSEFRMQVPFIFEITNEPYNTGWTILRPKKFPASLPEILHWDTPPLVRNYYPPVYPRTAFIEGRKGKVTVDFLVGLDGTVLKTSSSSKSDPDFVKAAIAAVQTFEFFPAEKNGEPCGAMLSLGFDFRPRIASDAEVTVEMKRLAKILKRSPEKILSLKQIDSGLKPISQRAPITPPTFRNTNQPKEVKVEFIISKDGTVELPVALEGSDAELAFAAVQAVSSWMFTIPRKDGAPVDVRAVVPIEFR
ncbi:MAG: hypothetical protein SynsKO_04980 [Synoicihabitans sp.]